MLDSGPRRGKLPQLVSRLPFPAEWRVLLIFDASSSGLAGAERDGRLRHAPRLSGERGRRAASADHGERAAGACGARLRDVLRRRSGSCKLPWAPISRLCKGDPMRAPRVGQALDWLRGQGVSGLGQSSWGPTGFAFAASEAEGQALLRGLRAEIRHRGLSFELAQGRNEGAKIETTAERNPVKRAPRFQQGDADRRWGTPAFCT